jgi:hypothetical protein
MNCAHFGKVLVTPYREAPDGSGSLFITEVFWWKTSSSVYDYIFPFLITQYVQIETKYCTKQYIPAAFSCWDIVLKSICWGVARFFKVLYLRVYFREMTYCTKKYRVDAACL